MKVISWLNTSLFIFCFAIFTINNTKADQKKFVIIVTSYNNYENNALYKVNLDSISIQTFPNLRMIYIDDASTDGTADYVEQYIAHTNLKDKSILIKNTERVGAHKNIYTAVHMCAPEEIVVIVDGDDWLSGPDVLEYLNSIYQDSNVWLTYGQFVYWPKQSPGIAAQIPQRVIDSNGFRSYSWVTTHLRTFYAALYHRIKYEDLLLWDGSFIRKAGDLAIMLPMLEMASNHSRFISKVLYVHNGYRNTSDQSNVLNQKKPIDDIPHTKVAAYLRKKEKYQKIGHLFEKNNI